MSPKNHCLSCAFGSTLSQCKRLLYVGSQEEDYVQREKEQELVRKERYPRDIFHRNYFDLPALACSNKYCRMEGDPLAAVMSYIYIEV